MVVIIFHASCLLGRDIEKGENSDILWRPGNRETTPRKHCDKFQKEDSKGTKCLATVIDKGSQSGMDSQGGYNKEMKNDSYKGVKR